MILSRSREFSVYVVRSFLSQYFTATAAVSSGYQLFQPAERCSNPVELASGAWRNSVCLWRQLAAR